MSEDKDRSWLLKMLIQDSLQKYERWSKVVENIEKASSGVAVPLTMADIEKAGRFTRGHCEDCGLYKVVYTKTSLCPACTMIRGAPP